MPTEHSYYNVYHTKSTGSPRKIEWEFRTKIHDFHLRPEIARLLAVNPIY
jgi:hypothetical protein